MLYHVTYCRWSNWRATKSRKRKTRCESTLAPRQKRDHVVGDRLPPPRSMCLRSTGARGRRRCVRRWPSSSFCEEATGTRPRQGDLLRGSWIRVRGSIGVQQNPPFCIDGTGNKLANKRPRRGVSLRGFSIRVRSSIGVRKICTNPHLYRWNG